MAQTRKSDEPRGSGPGPSKQEIRARVAYESERRPRLGTPAIAGGVLYLWGGSSSREPEAPAHGRHPPGHRPRAARRSQPRRQPGYGGGEVHQRPRLRPDRRQLRPGARDPRSSSWCCSFCYGAIRFRRPETSAAARPLLLVGGAVMVLVTSCPPVCAGVQCTPLRDRPRLHRRCRQPGTDPGVVLEATQYLGLAGGLALAVGMVS